MIKVPPQLVDVADVDQGLNPSGQSFIITSAVFLALFFKRLLKGGNQDQLLLQAEHRWLVPS